MGLVCSQIHIWSLQYGLQNGAGRPTEPHKPNLKFAFTVQPADLVSKQIQHGHELFDPRNKSAPMGTAATRWPPSYPQFLLLEDIHLQIPWLKATCIPIALVGKPTQTCCLGEVLIPVGGAVQIMALPIPAASIWYTDACTLEDNCARIIDVESFRATCWCMTDEWEGQGSIRGSSIVAR